jgi:hypothetical protein
MCVTRDEYSVFTNVVLNEEALAAGMHCSVPNGQSPTLMLNHPLLSTEVLEDTSVARFVNT